MSRNRLVAFCAWAVVMAIVWALFVPRGLSVETFTMLTLSGPLLLVAASMLWGANRLRPAGAPGPRRNTETLPAERDNRRS